MPVILVPCKSLASGKSRLAGLLTQAERQALCERFLADTLKLARGIAGAANVRLVSADEKAREIAAGEGIETFAEAWPDLNAALSGARAELAKSGLPAEVLILPIDIPLATEKSLASVTAAAGDVVIVPDRRQAGTNVLLLRNGAFADFRFAYGENSFRVHVDNALAQNRNPTILRNEALEFDIDEPDDYLKWKRAFG